MRLVGVGLVILAFTLSPARFPPIPSLFGYGAVVVPLLFMEIRLLK